MMVRGLLHPFDDPQITIGALAEDLERLLVTGAVMRDGSFLDAVEFDDHGALENAGLIGLAAVPRARNRPPAAWIAGPASLA